MTIKQGYLNKRGGSGFLARWRLKFVSLSLESTQAVLSIHDKRSQAPKHRIPLNATHVEIPTKNIPGVSERDASNAIIIHTTTRKVANIP